MNPTIKKLGYVPDAIMINVPEGYFQYDGKIKGQELREKAFREHYERMGTPLDENGIFYHFISSCPTVEDITHVYVCFRGRVQYKAILVEFLKNQPVEHPVFSHPFPRDWCVTTGPVIKAPNTDEMIMKGFRGFRYTKQLF